MWESDILQISGFLYNFKDNSKRKITEIVGTISIINPPKVLCSEFNNYGIRTENGMQII